RAWSLRFRLVPSTGTKTYGCSAARSAHARVTAEPIAAAATCGFSRKSYAPWRAAGVANTSDTRPDGDSAASVAIATNRAVLRVSPNAAPANSSRAHWRTRFRSRAMLPEHVADQPNSRGLIEMEPMLSAPWRGAGAETAEGERHAQDL